MYKVRNIQIKSNHPLFSWCEEYSKLSTNLFNAALFRERQFLTSKNKEILSINEEEILKEIELTNKIKGLETPKSMINYNYFVHMMTVNNNKDYYAGLPMQTSQNVLKEVCQCMKSFYELIKLHKQGKLENKPNLPHYKTKKSRSSFILSNQDCKIRQSEKGNYYCKMPKTKQIVNLGKKIEGRLKQVIVTPLHGIFQISFVLETENTLKKVPISRIASIDLGVNNLMAVTNNCGLECLLFKSKTLKSVNQFYNKCLANEMSKQTLKTKDYFKVDKKCEKLYLKRHNQIKDYIFKTSYLLMNWCVENRIDTIVVGKNEGWKSSINIGSVNNQNFVQIPHSKLIKVIKYSCERLGINFIEQEESYTSKASFLDNDFIYTYQVDDEKVSFSGNRIKRGLYKSSDGTKINADLNGSANILRKYLNETFDVDFNNIKVYNVKVGKKYSPKRR